MPTHLMGKKRKFFFFLFLFFLFFFFFFLLHSVFLLFILRNSDLNPGFTEN